MLYILIGNIISLVACSISAASGYVKSKGKTLVMQTIQLSLSTLSCVVLGSISGVVLNALAVPRNIFAYKNKLILPVKIVIAVLSAVFAFVFNTKGWIGLVPIIPTVIYTFLLDKTNPKQFKALVIFLMTFWTIHDFMIKSYVASVFNVIQILLSAAAIVEMTHTEKGTYTTSLSVSCAFLAAFVIMFAAICIVL